MLNWLKQAQPAAHDPTLPDILSLAGQEVPLVWSRHHQARRITLRYDARRRRVKLTLPKRAPLRLAAAFLKEKESWLIAQLKAHPAGLPFVDGAVIPVLGERLTIRHVESLRGRVERQGDSLLVPCPAASLGKRVEDWLRAHVREEILKDATAMAAQAGVGFRRVSVRDTASRWGSCSHEGNLSFCWRLVFAPRHILAYLVAHEVAHLREMNHSPAFWREVERLYPDHEAARRWLNRHANELHRYGA